MRLVSVNVERSKNLGTVLPFLRKLNPDIACLQELLVRDIPRFEEIVGSCVVYGPNCLHVPDHPDTKPQVMGVGIFTRLPILLADTRYYCGSKKKAVSPPEKVYMEDHCLALCDVLFGDRVYRCATTHFTWTQRGEANDLQRLNMSRLMQVLDGYGDFVLTGDYNAPRGGEIFAKLSSRLKDNIPAHHETSIDVSVHAAGRLRPHELADKMVDGLFTTPGYAASNVELVFGVSDHAAIVADICKV
jgi:hypothetical protein